MDQHSLKPWKAGVGSLVCGAIALLFYEAGCIGAAFAMTFVAGMFLEDWGYRMRDKYTAIANDGQS